MSSSTLLTIAVLSNVLFWAFSIDDSKVQFSIKYVTGPTLRSGQSLHLKCTGQTAQFYHWKRNGRLICDSSQPIDPSSRFRCSNNDLVVPIVDARDDGQYLCLAPRVGKSAPVTVTVTAVPCTDHTPSVTTPTPGTSKSTTGTERSTNTTTRSTNTTTRSTNTTTRSTNITTRVRSTNTTTRSTNTTTRSTNTTTRSTNIVTRPTTVSTTGILTKYQGGNNTVTSRDAFPTTMLTTNTTAKAAGSVTFCCIWISILSVLAVVWNSTE
ncbi:mucin-5AC-like isoform X1 [Corticium candelabrum]|uniref:mucin-5AC-like isoform X1 n=1 Tax=Corticium candelabrum TaxID=121492 RepID=UPI002E258553|nr:mucin-5AC-like isoform X1 [Corticium candelabrum]